MRPDRLVVGEVREAEALDLLLALNSGIPGLATLHANSGNDALRKLSTLPLLAGQNIQSEFVTPTVASTVDLVVHCRSASDGHRFVSEIIAPTGQLTDSRIETVSLFECGKSRGSQLHQTGRLPVRAEKYLAHGIDLEPLLRAA